MTATSAPVRPGAATSGVPRIAVVQFPGTNCARETALALVRAGFGQRRKMLRRSLAELVAPEHFVAAGVRPEARAEELGVEEWGRLARAVGG